MDWGSVFCPPPFREEVLSYLLWHRQFIVFIAFLSHDMSSSTLLLTFLRLLYKQHSTLLEQTFDPDGHASSSWSRLTRELRG